MSELRWKVVLVDRMQFAPKRRTKNRRIRKKWRKRPENWKPLMVPVRVVVLMGKHALAASTSLDGEPSPYFNEEDPSRPRMLEMHTKLWELTKEKVPEFAKLCDVFRRVKSTRGFIVDVLEGGA